MLCENLREFRLSTGLNQKQFAESIGLSTSTYNNYETGAREPKSDVLMRIAQNYNTTIDYLLGLSNSSMRISTGVEETNETTNKEHCKNNKNLTEATQLFKKLTPEFQDYVLDQITKLLEIQQKSDEL